MIRSVLSVAFLGMLAFAMQSCNKKNGIENDTILKKPFAIYVADANGSLYLVNSVDTGSLIFPTDGFSARAILVAKDNILFVKSNVFLSEDEGDNFNVTYLKSFNFSFPSLNTQSYKTWQPIIHYAADQERIYLASIEGKGIVFSDDYGKKWTVDTSFDMDVIAGNISSFAQLKNNLLFSYSFVQDSLYRRDNKNDPWTNVIPVTPLPNAPFYLSHYNNELIATDFSGNAGVYHSSDNGVNWTKYNGLPNRILYTTIAPFDQRLFVGTDSSGIYRLESTGFVPANNGLENFTTVYAFAGKDDVYENETKRSYIYAATNKGLYRSQDGGLNWIRVKKGIFTGLF